MASTIHVSFCEIYAGLIAARVFEVTSWLPGICGTTATENPEIAEYRVGVTQTFAFDIAHAAKSLASHGCVLFVRVVFGNLVFISFRLQVPITAAVIFSDGGSHRKSGRLGEIGLNREGVYQPPVVEAFN